VEMNAAREKFSRYCAMAVLLCLAAFSPPPAACGMAFNQTGATYTFSHLDLWNACFGISSPKAGSAYYKALKELSGKAIDGWKAHERYAGGGTLAAIQRKFPWFEPSPFQHRFLYHWGFSRSVSESRYHREIVRKTVPQDRRREERQLLAFLQRTWEDRRRSVLRSFQRALGGVFPSPNDVEAFAALAYDLHILGDYGATGDGRDQIAALIPPEPLAEELIKQGIRPLFGDRGSALEAALRRASDGVGEMASAEARRRAARDMANALLDALPSLMYENFGAEFAAQGLNIDVSKKFVIAGEGFAPWQLLPR